MAIYPLPVQWMETGTMFVNAPSLKEAVAKAYGDEPLPDQHDFLSDSFRVEDGEGNEVHPEDDMTNLMDWLVGNGFDEEEGG